MDRGWQVSVVGAGRVAADGRPRGRGRPDEALQTRLARGFSPCLPRRSERPGLGLLLPSSSVLPLPTAAGEPRSEGRLGSRERGWVGGLGGGSGGGEGGG